MQRKKVFAKQKMVSVAETDSLWQKFVIKLKMFT